MMKLRAALLVTFIFLFIAPIRLATAETPDSAATKKSAPSTPREALLGSFVQLDRALVPALQAVASGSSELSATALAALSAAWNETKKLHPTVPFDSKWKDTVSTVSARLEKTVLLHKEESLDEAYFALDEIRSALMECRARNSMSYFPDGLTEYHVELEKILQEISMAGVARPVTAVREELRRRLVPAAARAFAKARKIPLDPKLHEFDSAKEARVRQLIQKQQQILDDLGDATEEGSTDAVFETAKQLKPNFDRLYLVFGGGEG